MQTLSYKSVVMALTSKDMLRCKSCNLPISFKDVTMVAIDTGSVMYSCSICKDANFVTIDFQKLSNDLKIDFHLSEEDFEMPIMVCIDGKQINVRKKERMSISGEISKKINEGVFSCFKCKNVIKMDISEILEVDLNHSNVRYKCSKCGNSGFRSFDAIGITFDKMKYKATAEDKNWEIPIKMDYEVLNPKKETTEKCPKCKSIVPITEISEFTDFKIKMCKKCSESLLKCKKCNKEMLKGLSFEGNCVFCSGASSGLLKTEPRK